MTTPTVKKQWAYPVYHHDTGETQSIDALLKGMDSVQWNKSLTNELRRRAQGIGLTRLAIEQIEGTNTIIFVKKQQIPNNAKVTYANFVSDIRPHKKETHRTRLTVGGD